MVGGKDGRGQEGHWVKNTQIRQIRRSERHVGFAVGFAQGQRLQSWIVQNCWRGLGPSQSWQLERFQMNCSRFR